MREFMNRADKGELKFTQAVPLTKREVFALRIACALLQNPKVTQRDWTGKMQSVHWDAIVEADRLLAELSKTYESHSVPF